MAAGALGVLMIRRITALPIAPDAIVVSDRHRPQTTWHFFHDVQLLLNSSMMETGREEGGQRSGISEAQEGLEVVEQEGVGRKEEEGERDGEGDVSGGDIHVGGGDAGGGGAGGGGAGGGDAGGGDAGGGGAGGGDAGGGGAGRGGAGGGGAGGGDAGGGGESTSAVMEVKKKSGRAKKKEKRLRSEPPSLTGK